MNHQKYATPEDAAWAVSFSSYVRRARDRNIPHDITFDQHKEMCLQSCFYCGAPPIKRLGPRGKGVIMTLGIDRIDSNLGYIPGNIVPCCTWCNKAKHSGTAEEFIAHCKRVVDHLKGD